MKIEEVIQELKIRFGENAMESKDIDFLPNFMNQKKAEYGIRLDPNGNVAFIRNKCGVLFNNGKWATARITEAPKVYDWGFAWNISKIINGHPRFGIIDEIQKGEYKYKLAGLSNSFKNFQKVDIKKPLEQILKEFKI